MSNEKPKKGAALGIPETKTLEERDVNMRQVVLKTNRDLDIVLAALFSVPAKGVEALRLFDKVLTALETSGAALKYTENGDVEIFEREADGRVKVEDGKPKRASYLAKAPIQIDLAEGVANWLKDRIERVEWNGGAARAVLQIVEQLGGSSQAAAGEAE